MVAVFCFVIMYLYYSMSRLSKLANIGLLKNSGIFMPSSLIIIAMVLKFEDLHLLFIIAFIVL